MKRSILIYLLSLPLLAFSQGSTANNLNGEWTFSLDPVKVGENNRWFKEDFQSENFDKVKVPHCFSVDPRYQFYTGTAWYFKKFNASFAGDKHVFLKFDAVFYKSKIWLNGQLIGRHEGGYTPFELDVTKQLKTKNVLAVQVDNSWDTTTIPGAKTAVDYTSVSNSQVYPWINYGGITRSVHLIARSPAFVQNIKVVADPDLKKGNASIRIKAFIKNCAAVAVSSVVQASVSTNGKNSSIRFKAADVVVAPGSEAVVEFENTLPAAEVKLWNTDEPNLYTAEVSVGTDTVSRNFGIRKIEISGTKLLLNGEPVKMGGCNRPLDYPGYGSLDPDEVLEKDLKLIKSGGMELSRISHYPVSESLLNWADKHGLLLITEAGNWQMTPKQLRDTMMRRKFQSQMKEMIERDWNHPSVIAYSVGNEFQSHAEEGKAWVRDMSGFVKSIDPSRLVTFASMFVWRDFIKKPEDEASQYVDFISANIYGNYLKNLQHIHELYPGKPIYISEFGIRADAVKTEQERVEHLRKAMDDFRQCDYLIGASVWTFNDYRSRFPGTNANGYRPWGLVSPERDIRDMYKAWQEEFSPATIELSETENRTKVITVTARKDFPSYTMKGYQLKCNNHTVALNTLRPGNSQQLNASLPDGTVAVELIKPGGFVIMQKVFKIK